jgi:integrase
MRDALGGGGGLVPGIGAALARLAGGLRVDGLQSFLDLREGQVRSESGAGVPNGAAGLALYALFHLIAFRGLRRGEACGQKCTDTNLNAGLITVAKQLVVDGWEVYEDDPKTDAGARTVALDSDTVQALKRHRVQQDKDREEWGSAWVETGRVFTKENGEMLHPANVTRRFVELYEEIDLPPVRLHDLRHGAATLAHAAGADLKDIQEMLGHSSITITADTYTSLLPEADLAIAEAAARLVPRARVTSENTVPEAAPDPEGEEEPDAESVPNGADPLGDISEINSPSAHAPLTQTAPDEESEAE